MKISVRLRGGKKRIDMEGKPRVIDVLEKLEINPETVIVRKGEEVIPEEECLRENDEIEAIRIISGG